MRLASASAGVVDLDLSCDRVRNLNTHADGVEGESEVANRAELHDGGGFVGESSSHGEPSVYQVNRLLMVPAGRHGSQGTVDEQQRGIP